MHRKKAGTAALLTAFALATAAQAQVDDFQLPPGTPAPAAGPTDSNVPSPTPQPSAPPRITVPSPTPAPLLTPRATPRAAPTAAARPAPSASPSPRPAATAPAAALPSPSATVSAPAAVETGAVPEATASAAPSEAPVLTPTTGSEKKTDWLWWAIAGSVALLLAFGGYLLGRRSGKAAPDWDEPDAPEPEAGETTASVPAPPASAPAAPLPSPVFAPRPFDMQLEPLRMTLAMINASLTYRLAIVNRDDRALGPLRITCDLISAHASLETAQQLVPDPAKAWLSHDFEALPPGERLVVDGEVRLPRTEILPVRSGDSQLFLPLARFTLQTLEHGVPLIVGARIFVIGEEPDQPGAPLRPFRLNEGTRSYSRIAQREVTRDG